MNRFNLSLIMLLLTVSCSRPEVSPEQEGRVIVIMYHNIVEGQAEGTYDRNITDFENDLIYLNNNDINTISFNDLFMFKESGTIPAGEHAIITFDDGDVSWYTSVRPILLKYGMEATFFLWTGNIGNDNFINWSQIELMSRYQYSDGRRPFNFESHSYSHPYLLGRKADFENLAGYGLFLDYELGESKRIIESHTQLPVNVFALPYGDGAGDASIIAASERQGYKMIRTSKRGIIENTDHDLFNIPSLPVLNNTGAEQIGLMLNIR